MPIGMLTGNSLKPTSACNIKIMKTVWEKYGDLQDHLLKKYGKDIKLSGEEWVKELNDGITILDPDGWDRSNWEVSWNEKINLHEFYRRRDMSTNCGSPRL